MKILLWSYSFHPYVGGIETMTDILATQFSALGHRVTVVTMSLDPDAQPVARPFDVIRAPSTSRLIRLVNDCDVFLHNHLSLKAAFPLLFIRRPWVIIYQTWYPTSGLRGLLQPLLTRSAVNVAISEAIAEYIRPRCRIIPNAYDNTTFREMPEIPRDGDLLFVGRLVEDKGVQVLLDSLALLRDEGLTPRLTVVGEGEFEGKLKEKVTELALSNQVQFVGKKAGRELVEVMNRHRIAVVPSVWREPFGIVALEAIACGCVVVGSEGGGLKEAIGPCGVTFPNGDAPALAGKLSQLLRNPNSWPAYRQEAEAHLSQFTPAAVAEAYLNTIGEIRQSAQTVDFASHSAITRKG